MNPNPGAPTRFRPSSGMADAPWHGIAAMAALMALFYGLGVLLALTMGGPDHEDHGEGFGGDKPYTPGDFQNIEWEPFKANAPPRDQWKTGGPPVLVPRKPLDEDIWPCSQCHDPDDEPDTTPRKLDDPHEDKVLNHGPSDRWCFDCHEPRDRDKLHLTSGLKVNFDDSHRLCGQCHGRIRRDWERGIHGRRIGYWNGFKIYFHCVQCHDPHHPRFQRLKPLPPPVRPANLRDHE